MIFKWQESAWKRLTGPGQRRPHAFLMHGPAGSGKRRLAEAFAAWHLCETDRAERPCGVCDACRWLGQASHPDLRVLEPEGASEDADPAEAGGSRGAKRSRPLITIDQVRALSDFLAVSPHRGRAKVVLVVPADTLNAHAANALLKSLEEPPPDTVFLLVAHRLRQLPATVLSRCVRVPLPLPAQADAVAWLAERGIKEPLARLAEAGGAPLLAEEQAREGRRAERDALYALLRDPAAIDPVRDAATVDRIDLLSLVEWHQKWCCDLLQASMRGPVRYNPQLDGVLRRLAERVEPWRLAVHWRGVVDLRRLARHPLNPRLYCEDLLQRYCRVFSRP
jgi:DNA polymerase-3 subunit delta'